MHGPYYIAGGRVPGRLGLTIGRIGLAGPLLTALAGSIGAVPASAAEATRVSLPSVFFEAPGESGRFASWNDPIKMQLSPGNIEFLVGDSPVRLIFTGGQTLVKPRGEERLANEFQFFQASLASRAAAFTSVRYPQIYPGIDVVFHSGSEFLKSEFQVEGGANPALIRLRYEGARVSLDDLGGLRIQSQGAELRERSPVIFQMENGRRTPVEGKFRIEADGTVGFQIGRYEKTLPLVIDPALTYSLLVNGNTDSEASAVVSDAQGNLYVAGWTDSVNFPTAGAEQPASGGGNDVFVFKLNSQGNALIYGTFLGGSSDDRAFGLAVDSNGEAVVTGWTQSTNFPTYLPAQAASGGGQDAFVAKLNAAGNGLVFSTYLGGNGTDAGYGVAVDVFGAIHVVGDTLSTNFPTRSAVQYASGGRQDAFFTEFGPSGNLLASSYLGGNGDDHGAGVAVDRSGNTYVTGSTYSTNFPTVLPFQAHSGGGQDAFVTKIGASGSALLYSTYLGGSSGMPTAPETGSAIAVDGQGYAYVAGTTSSSNFPTVNPLYAGHSYATDAFLTKLDVTGRFLVYSTYIGGSSFDYGNAVAVDGGGNAYVAGMTSSWDFPVVNPVQASLAGSYDGFVVKINAAGTVQTFGTWIGGSFADSASGIALDHLGNLYVAGQTNSANFPILGGLNSGTVGGINAFVTALDRAGYFTPGDFNTDGFSDLVWQNDSTRQVTVWYMGGTGDATPEGWSFLSGGEPGWTLAVATDLNGDGIPDLIWQDDATRQVTVWYMGGPGGTSDQGWAFIDPTGEAGWTVVAAADFDGNGVPDLVWQNDATGKATVWYMGGPAGASIQGWAVLGSIGNPNLRIVGAGDFDRNGFPDVVLQNSATRQVSVWYMGGQGGAEQIGSAYLNSAGMPGWTLRDVKDLNGDGVPDLLWENDATRQITVWYMGGPGGATQLSSTSIAPGGVPGWHLVPAP